MESSDPVPKAFPFGRRILSWYHIHYLHYSGIFSAGDVKKPGIKVNASYKNRLLLVGLFNRRHIALVVSKVL